MAVPPLQLPSPSQVLMGVSLPLVQVAVTHSVPTANFAQPPAPLQRPLVPQVDRASTLHCMCGSGLPTATGVHSPSEPTWLQLTHGPWHGKLQQRPSTQLFDWHSLAMLQAAPRPFGPHDPDLHSRPSHWVEAVHAAKHFPAVGSQL